MIALEDIVIDDELAAMLPEQSEEERVQFLTSIEADGFRDPIVVWMNHGIVVDGHHRLQLWQQVYRDDPDKCPEVIEKHFHDRDAVKRWMIRNQLGRRNLDPKKASYLRGLLYNESKGDPHSRPGNENAKRGTQKEDREKTAARIAAETGVSRATIERDGKYAEAAGKAMGSGEKLDDVLKKPKREVIREHAPPKQRKQQAPQQPAQQSDQSKTKKAQSEVGMALANEAIEKLKSIPYHDKFRRRGYEFVMKYLKHAIESLPT